MSGNDERRANKYPPGCPKCLNCHEWFLGKGTWILPKNSMLKRNLKHPVICLGITPITHVVGIICQGCGKRYRNDNETFQGVLRAYKFNHGDIYHKDISAYGRTSNEWKG